MLSRETVQRTGAPSSNPGSQNCWVKPGSPLSTARGVVCWEVADFLSGVRCWGVWETVSTHLVEDVTLAAEIEVGEDAGRPDVGHR